MPKPPSIKSTDNERQREDFDSRAPLAETILRRLYSYMLKCRMVEERIRLLFRQGRFSGNYFAAVGQEATEVGATMDLLAEDTIAPSHRNFVTHIMKGTPLTLMFAHIFLRKDSPDQGRCVQAHCGYAPLNIITPASTIAAQLAARTSRVVVFHEANRTLGIGAEVSAILAEEAFELSGRSYRPSHRAGHSRDSRLPAVEEILYAVGGEDRRHSETHPGLLGSFRWLAAHLRWRFRRVNLRRRRIEVGHAANEPMKHDISVLSPAMLELMAL